MEAFEKVLGAASTASRRGQEAALGKAAALRGLGRIEDALALLKSLAEAETSPAFHRRVLFQQALAHYGMRCLPDHAEEKVRQKATKRLIETVASLYKDANNLEKAGNYTQARANYETIHDYIHEPHNLIHRNVSQRLRALREKIKEERR